VLSVDCGRGSPQDIRIAELGINPVAVLSDGKEEMARISAPPADLLGAVPEDLNVTAGTLSGQWRGNSHEPGDLFYARCELADGTTFFSNVVTPFAAGKPMTIPVWQTSTSLDNDPQSYLTLPPHAQPGMTSVAVHPAIVQRMGWDFAAGGNIVPPSVGCQPLYLGSGDVWYKVDAKRLPTRWQREDGSTCLMFDGVDDIAEIPERQVPLGAFSVSMDLLVASGKRGTRQVVMERIGSSAMPVLAVLSDGRLEAGRTARPDQRVVARTSEPVPEDQWMHVRWTYDLNKITLYLNDQEIASVGAAAWAPPYGNCRAYLGGLPGSPFKGGIANVRIESAPAP
jgi:hypothetical protein